MSGHAECVRVIIDVLRAIMEDDEASPRVPSRVRRGTTGHMNCLNPFAAFHDLSSLGLSPPSPGLKGTDWSELTGEDDGAGLREKNGGAEGSIAAPSSPVMGSDDDDDHKRGGRERKPSLLDVGDSIGRSALLAIAGGNIAAASVLCDAGADRRQRVDDRTLPGGGARTGRVLRNLAPLTGLPAPGAACSQFADREGGVGPFGMGVGRRALASLPRRWTRGTAAGGPL